MLRGKVRKQDKETRLREMLDLVGEQNMTEMVRMYIEKENTYKQEFMTSRYSGLKSFNL